MPFQSKAQAGFMYTHKNDTGKLGGVAKDFISASHGMKVSKLPQRVKAKKPRKLPVFGSLAPTQSGHYDGDMPE